jgi:hypothetical protein
VAGRIIVAPAFTAPAARAVRFDASEARASAASRMYRDTLVPTTPYALLAV